MLRQGNRNILLKAGPTRRRNGALYILQKHRYCVASTALMWWTTLKSIKVIRMLILFKKMFNLINLKKLNFVSVWNGCAWQPCHACYTTTRSSKDVKEIVGSAEPNRRYKLHCIERVMHCVHNPRVVFARLILVSRLPHCNEHRPGWHASSSSSVSKRWRCV